MVLLEEGLADTVFDGLLVVETLLWVELLPEEGLAVTVFVGLVVVETLLWVVVLLVEGLVATVFAGLFVACLVSVLVTVLRLAELPDTLVFLTWLLVLPLVRLTVLLVDVTGVDLLLCSVYVL